MTWGTLFCIIYDTVPKRGTSAGDSKIACARCPMKKKKKKKGERQQNSCARCQARFALTWRIY